MLTAAVAAKAQKESLVANVVLAVFPGSEGSRFISL